jgi:hypothetical protein
MPSSEANNQWVRRWRYVMAPTSKRGIWRLREGGYFVRVRVTDPRTGRRIQCARVVRGPTVTLRDAICVRDSLRLEGHDRVAGRIQSLPLWSEYATSLFEAKVAEGRLSSSKSRERWGNVLSRLIPAFGRIRVDELRAADLIEWRDRVGRWLRDGMPSSRKRDIGKNRIVTLAYGSARLRLGVDVPLRARRASSSRWPLEDVAQVPEAGRHRRAVHDPWFETHVHRLGPMGWR